MLLALNPNPPWLFSHNSTSFESRPTSPQPFRCEKSSPLLVVPPELIHEIFLHLGHQALVSVRQVCRTFYNVSSSRQFCYARIEQLASRPGATTAGISLEDSSTERLSRWLLHQLRILDRWRSPFPPQFRIRLVNGTTSFVQTTVLSGGRWMLGLDFNGSVRVIDLSREQSRPRLLFRTTRPRGFPLTKVQTWVDEREGGQRFRVALYNLDCLPNFATRIYVYGVEVTGVGIEANLITTPIAITPESQRQGPRFSLCFDRDYLLQTCLFFDEPTHGIGSVRVELRRYTEPWSACEVDLSMVSEPGLASINHISGPANTNKAIQIQAVFLPHDRIAVIIPNSIMVFGIEHPNETRLKLTPLHNLSLVQNPLILSTPFKGPFGTYLITHCEDQIKKIMFHHDSAIPPTVMVLGELKFDQRLASESNMRFGPSTALFLSSDTQLKIATYSLDNTTAFSRKSYVRSSHALWHIHGIAAFDEALGRIVLECNGNDLLVLDLL